MPFGVDDIGVMLGLGVLGAGLSAGASALMAPDTPTYPKPPGPGFDISQQPRPPAQVAPSTSPAPVPAPQFSDASQALRAYRQALGVYMQEGQLK